MKSVALIIQLSVAFVLLNVWLLRFNQPTPYRGGHSTSMREEFSTYGLPNWTLWAVGTLKVSCALLLVAGIWIPSLVLPAAGLIATLMLGAISMHLKVRDPLIKSLPASAVLALTAFVLAAAK
jgi:hypothetical protein